jgi:hypothetical protein
VLHSSMSVFSFSILFGIAHTMFFPTTLIEILGSGLFFFLLWQTSECSFVVFKHHITLSPFERDLRSHMEISSYLDSAVGRSCLRS